MIRAFFLYVDAEGHSNFKKGSVSESAISEALTITFKETPADFFYDWHTAPTTQYVLTLSGELEFTTSRGEIFTLKPGDVLVATDITGKGHKWRMVGNEPWKRAYVRFHKDAEINFTSD